MNVEATFFSTEELQEAIRKTKSKKAPSTDGTTTEITKAVVEGNIYILLEAHNKLWKNGRFPLKWKVSKLVLIEKPKKVSKTPDFRPIYLINVLVKIYERLIKTRLELETEQQGNLHDRQFGFRTNRSTVEVC